jgi:hypothetical protein
MSKAALSLIPFLAALLAACPAPAAPRNAAPPAAAEVRLDRQFLIGRWTDDGDCGPDSETAIDFTPDGRFLAANSSIGLWRLEGDALTMTGERTITIRIVPVDHDTITVINPDGSLGRSTRCAAGTGFIAGAQGTT